MASKYCLIVHLQSAETPHPSWNGLKVAALAVPPSIDDNRVFAPRPVDYVVKQDVGDNGEFVRIVVRFNTEIDATEFYDNARGLSGIFTACKQGSPGSSYMHVHECFIPGQRCSIISGKEVKST